MAEEEEEEEEEGKGATSARKRTQWWGSERSICNVGAEAHRQRLARSPGVSLSPSLAAFQQSPSIRPGHSLHMHRWEKASGCFSGCWGGVFGALASAPLLAGVVGLWRGKGGKEGETAGGVPGCSPVHFTLFTLFSRSSSIARISRRRCCAVVMSNQPAGGGGVGCALAGCPGELGSGREKKLNGLRNLPLPRLLLPACPSGQ